MLPLLRVEEHQAARRFQLGRGLVIAVVTLLMFNSSEYEDMIALNRLRLER